MIDANLTSLNPGDSEHERDPVNIKPENGNGSNRARSQVGWMRPTQRKRQDHQPHSYTMTSGKDRVQ